MQNNNSGLINFEVVVPCLQHPTWRSKTPHDTMFTTSPKELIIQHKVHLKKCLLMKILLRKNADEIKRNHY